MSQRLRILVIGAGSIGERHIRCLLRTGRAEVGVCETAAAQRDRVAAAYPVSAAFPSLDAAMQERWGGAVVATPAQTHVPLAVRLVTAGLGTLIEKPLAVSPAGVGALLDAASGGGVSVGVAYVYRAHPALRAMREAIASGRFGRPLQLITVAGQNFPTYRPAYASTYYARHEHGGGAIQDALTHVFNAAEWLVGPITRIAADAGHMALPGVEVEDTVHALARHGDVLASYSLNQHQAPNECTITVVCERGTARFELHRHAWRWMERPDTPWQEEVTQFAERDDWFTAQENAWLDALGGAAAPLCSLEEGLQTLRVNLATLASVREGGRWVNVASMDQETTT